MDYISIDCRRPTHFFFFTAHVRWFGVVLIPNGAFDIQRQLVDRVRYNFTGPRGILPDRASGKILSERSLRERYPCL